MRTTPAQPGGADRRVLFSWAGVAGLTPLLPPVLGAPELAAGMYSARQLPEVVANLADAYDDAGPHRVAEYAPRVEAMVLAALCGRRCRGGVRRDLVAAYARLLTVYAAATGDAGGGECFRESARAAGAAFEFAEESGDAPAAGRALCLLAHAQQDLGEHTRALGTAQRARQVAPGHPSEVGALLAEASALAALGAHDRALQAVQAAQRAHAVLGEDQWGDGPEYPLTGFHPARLQAQGGWVLVQACWGAQAAALLDQAEETLTQSGHHGSAWLADVWLSRALTLLTAGDVAAAHDYAAMAVAHQEDHRPGWVSRRVAMLNARAGGVFTGLAWQVRDWPHPAWVGGAATRRGDGG